MTSDAVEHNYTMEIFFVVIKHQQFFLSSVICSCSSRVYFFIVISLFVAIFQLFDKEKKHRTQKNYFKFLMIRMSLSYTQCLSTLLHTTIRIWV